jgi:glycosyltransferase involved in cell wall biosynthesis
MKIFICSPYPIEGPSARYRLYQFEVPMRHHEIEFEIYPLMTSDIFWRKSNQLSLRWFDYFTLFFRFITRIFKIIFNQYDAVLIHREFSPFAREFFHAIFPFFTSKPLIYDYDDAVFVQFPIKRLLKKAQIILAGNVFLSQYAKEFAEEKNIYYFPTVVDLAHYKKTPKQTDKPVVVGWIGTHSTFETYLLPFIEIISDICVKNNAEFHIICSSSVKKTTENFPVVFREWSLDKEIEYLNEFDIGIMPLKDNEFTRGKCAFKLIEYGALSIPSVGSKVGANSTVIEHGINGFLADTETEWATFLNELIQNSALRETMGKAAFLKVKNEFSLESKVDTLAAILKSAIKG